MSNMGDYELQKQPTRVFSKKRCSQKFRKIHVKTPVPESLFYKKRFWQRWFRVNFAKFLRTPLLQNTSWRLLLELLQYESEIIYFLSFFLIGWLVELTQALHPTFASQIDELATLNYTVNISLFHYFQPMFPFL